MKAKVTECLSYLSYVCFFVFYFVLSASRIRIIGFLRERVQRNTDLWDPKLLHLDRCHTQIQTSPSRWSYKRVSVRWCLWCREEVSGAHTDNEWQVERVSGSQVPVTVNDNIGTFEILLSRSVKVQCLHVMSRFLNYEIWNNRNTL